MSANAAEKVSHDSKAEKKNKKRKNKKTKALSSEDSSKSLKHEEMLVILKSDLAEAKLNKDHALAGEIREQIWVLTDLAAGVKTAIPEEELDKILARTFAKFHPPPASPPSSSLLPSTTSAAATDTPSGNPAAVCTCPLFPEDRRLKVLRKRLEQIEWLKEKKKNGDKLEANQLDKIKNEAAIEYEIKEIEEILATNVYAIRL